MCLVRQKACSCLKQISPCILTVHGARRDIALAKVQLDLPLVAALLDLELCSAPEALFVHVKIQPQRLPNEHLHVESGRSSQEGEQ